MIGKPYSGAKLDQRGNKLNVRFDEGELEIECQPLRQLSTLPSFYWVHEPDKPDKQDQQDQPDKPDQPDQPDQPESPLFRWQKVF